MSIMSKNLKGVPVFHDELVEIARDEFDRMHPGDTFDDRMRRARFDKHDQGLLWEWLALAAEREMQSSVVNQLDSLL